MSRRISSYQNTICKNGKLIHFDEITKRSIYTMNKSVYCFEKDNDVYYKLDRNEGFAYSIMNIYYKKSLKIKYPYFLKDKIDTCIANDSFHKMQNIFKPLPFMHLNEKLIDLFIKSMQCYTLDDRYILKSSFFKNGDLDTCSINGDYVIFKRDNNLFLSNYLYDDYLEQMKEVNKYIEIIDFNLLESLDKKSVAIASDNFKFDFFIHGNLSDNRFVIEMVSKDEKYAIDEKFSDKTIEIPIRNRNYHPLMNATMDILLQTSANECFHSLMRKYIQDYNNIVTPEIIKVYRMITV